MIENENSLLLDVVKKSKEKKEFKKAREDYFKFAFFCFVVGLIGVFFKESLVWIPAFIFTLFFLVLVFFVLVQEHQENKKMELKE